METVSKIRKCLSCHQNVSRTLQENKAPIDATKLAPHLAIVVSFC